MAALPDSFLPAVNSDQLPLVVAINCFEEKGGAREPNGGGEVGTSKFSHPSLSYLLRGAARFESHSAPSLSLAERLPFASVILLHSLTFLPKALQQQFSRSQVILCAGAAPADRATETAAALELGLRLVHVDVSRIDEIGDSVLSLVLSLSRKVHHLSSLACSNAGFFGGFRDAWAGVTRLRGKTFGCIGMDAGGRAAARRAAALGMKVVYFHLESVSDARDSSARPYRNGSSDELGLAKEDGRTREEGVVRGEERAGSVAFVESRLKRHGVLAQRVDSLSCLLSVSDVVSLHCSVNKETEGIINEEAVKQFKKGSMLVNVSSCLLVEDRAVKHGLSKEGRIKQVALDGVEGTQWMEAWVREYPTVLILPRSAGFSEDVWEELRVKVSSVVLSFLRKKKEREERRREGGRSGHEEEEWGEEEELEPVHCIEDDNEREENILRGEERERKVVWGEEWARREGAREGMGVVREEIMIEETEEEEDEDGDGEGEPEREEDFLSRPPTLSEALDFARVKCSSQKEEERGEGEKVGEQGRLSEKDGVPEKEDEKGGEISERESEFFTLLRTASKLRVGIMPLGEGEKKGEGERWLGVSESGGVGEWALEERRGVSPGSNPACQFVLVCEKELLGCQSPAAGGRFLRALTNDAPTLVSSSLFSSLAPLPSASLAFVSTELDIMDSWFFTPLPLTSSLSALLRDDEKGGGRGRVREAVRLTNAYHSAVYADFVMEVLSP